MKKLALAALGAIAIVSAGAQTPAAKPDEKTLSEAYTYLLGRVLVIRQEHIDRRSDGFAYNTIKYNPLGSADFVNPNFDVAYFEAWLAVDDRTPVLLEIPEIKGRYYTVQILDEWGEVIVNINERTFPSKPFGKFALVKPGYRGINSSRCRSHRAAFQQGQDAWPCRDKGRSRGGCSPSAAIQSHCVGYAANCTAPCSCNVRQQGSDRRGNLR